MAARQKNPTLLTMSPERDPWQVQDQIGASLFVQADHLDSSIVPVDGARWHPLSRKLPAHPTQELDDSAIQKLMLTRKPNPSHTTFAFPLRVF